MASRRRARAFALQALYMRDFQQVEPSVALKGLWSGLGETEDFKGSRAPHAEEKEFAMRIVNGVGDSEGPIDEMIESCSTKWRVSRMPLVDRNILRICIYEMMWCEDIPATVSVNEAIELAKEFGGEESPRFVNGIVDEVGRKIRKLEPPTEAPSSEGEDS
jgi:N utilization substance protein B